MPSIFLCISWISLTFWLSPQQKLSTTFSFKLEKCHFFIVCCMTSQFCVVFGQHKCCWYIPLQNPLLIGSSITDFTFNTLYIWLNFLFCSKLFFSLGKPIENSWISCYSILLSFSAAPLREFTKTLHVVVELWSLLVLCTICYWTWYGFLGVATWS